MSKITYPIPPRGFELIRDAIAEIIITELEGQKTITSNPLFDAKVWVERFTPFDKFELAAIRLYFSISESVEKTTSQSKKDQSFNIEIHVNEKSNEDKSGDERASLLCTQLTGVIEHILEHPQYQYLGVEIGIVKKFSVSSRIGTPTQPDSTHSVVGLVTLTATVLEQNGVAPTTEFEGVDIVIIDNTKTTVNNLNI